MVDSVTGDVDDDAAEARALLILDRLSGVGLVTLRALVECFGSATGSLRASRRSFAEIAGDAAARRRSDREILRAVDRALEKSDRLGIEVTRRTSSASGTGSSTP